MIYIGGKKDSNMAQSATTIYLDEDQRKKLFKLAEERKSSFSSEIRAAIDRYVEEKESAFSEEEARLLARQANESIDRMARVLDEAHRTVARILKAEEKKGRK
jgi:predicted transcriptional regulator